MNNLTQILLGGAALCMLATASAVAGTAPVMHVMALHGGRVVNKTNIKQQCKPLVSSCLTYTLGVYTTVPASDFRKTVPLAGTFYKWNTTGDKCSSPPEKLKAPKKSKYAKVRGTTETYSLGCSSGPTVFYGDTYKLRDKSGFGQTDTFVSVLKTEYEKGDKTYKGTLYLDVSVAIGN